MSEQTQSNSRDLIDLPSFFRDLSSNSGPVNDSIKWWQKELEQAPPIHNLPTDFATSSRNSDETKRLTFTWDKTTWKSLEQLAECHGISASVGALAGFAALVRRYTEQDIVILGLPDLNAVNKSAPTYPIRFDFTPGTTFNELLEQTRHKLELIEDHPTCLDDLQTRLNINNDGSYAPIAQLLFGVTTADLADHSLADFNRFDFSLLLNGSTESASGTAIYDGRLFETDTIERLIDHLENLLAEAVQTPEDPIGGYSLPTERERRLILEEWNDTETPVDLHRCFHELFEDQVDKTPTKTAVVEPDGGELTYRQLDKKANLVANQLIDQGVEQEDLVAICVDRSLKLVVGILGILKSGGTYLPLNPSFPEERIEAILGETSPDYALTQSNLAETFDGAGAKRILIDDDWEKISAQSSARPGLDIESTQLAYMVYTSGSTGRPKGAMIEHRNVTNLSASLGPAFGVEPDDRVSQFASETFDATIWEFAMTFTSGATLVLLPKGQSLLGLELGTHLDEQNITAAPLPPAVVPDIPQELAEGVEKMIVAGEACPASVVDNWAPGRRFVNGYGPRETTGYATYAVCEANGEAPPIGQPLGNYKAYVLDDNQQVAPIGVYGELYIGGPGVGRGYYDRPELNAESFIEDPFSDKEDARMYKSGDIVRWRPDGQLEFLGRRDFQVQLRGFRVELGAIEQRLRDDDAVQDAVATKQEDSNGHDRLVAYVVSDSLDRDDALSKRLEDALERELPEYMVPSRIVVLKEFPLNTTGKVDRHALPVPEFTGLPSDRSIKPPRNEIEEKLVDGWKELLSISNVGVDENFFELGGTSLMIAQVVYQIKERFDVELPMRTFIDTPTIEQIAELIEKAKKDENELSNLCYDPTLELDQEAHLDSSIDGSNPLVDTPTNPNHILLTGATGFVGAHLLSELRDRTDARITCLIRSRNENELKDRIRSTFEDFDLQTSRLKDRIEAIEGDLTEKRLGLDRDRYEQLAESVDAVYHNGAMVDQVRGYQAMKPANVSGTQRMLAFATHRRVKPFHYVSTTGSVHYPEYEADGSVPEEAPAGPIGKLPNGYMQTKCVGEHIVQTAMERDIPASIYRLGAVSGHTETGACEPDDFTYSILRSAIDLGICDDLNPNYMITPVDFVARSIATLSRWSDGLDRTYHVTHPEPSWASTIIEQLKDMGYTIDERPYADFIDELLQHAREGTETPLLRFLPYLTQKRADADRYKAEEYYIPVDWDCSNLEAGYRQMDNDMDLPSIEQLIEDYIRQFIEAGYIEKPH